MNEREITMFGMRKEVLELSFSRLLRNVTPAELAVSMMSDAQEQIALGATEAARQTLNAAKYLLATRLPVGPEARKGLGSVIKVSISADRDL